MVKEKVLIEESELTHMTDQFQEKGAFYRNRVENVVGLVQPVRDDTILDMGCGIGTFVIELSKTCFTVGIDLSFNMLCEVKRLAGEEAILPVCLVCADVECLPFKDDSFSKAVSADVVEHLTNAELNNMASELFDALTLNSILIVYTPYKYHIFELLRSLRILEPDLTHIDLKTMQGLVRILERNDYSIMKKYFLPSHLKYFNFIERLFLNVPFVGLIFRRRLCVIARKRNPF